MYHECSKTRYVVTRFLKLLENIMLKRSEYCLMLHRDIVLKLCLKINRSPRCFTLPLLLIGAERQAKVKYVVRRLVVAKISIGTLFTTF